MLGRARGALVAAVFDADLRHVARVSRSQWRGAAQDLRAYAAVLEAKEQTYDAGQAADFAAVLELVAASMLGRRGLHGLPPGAVGLMQRSADRFRGVWWWTNRGDEDFTRLQVRRWV